MHCALPSSPATVPRARLEAARPLVARLGARSPVVRGLGLDRAPSSERRLPVAALDRLWDALVEREGVAVPLGVATEVRASSYGLLTYLLGCAPSGQHALRRLGLSYHELLSEGTRYRIAVDGRHVEIEARLQGRPRTAAAELFAAAAVVGFVAAEVLGQPRPLGIHLAIPPPPARSAGAFQRFFGGPMQFEAATSRLVYARRDLERGLRGSDPALCEILEDAAARRRPAPRPTAEAVGGLLAAAGPGARISQAEVAARMGMSARVLRRRLAEEGTGFQLVLDQARQRWAEAWLAEPGTRVAALAQALGYADTAAFRRAFRRWTGMSPAAWAGLVPADQPGTTAVSDSASPSTSWSSTVTSTQLRTPSPATSA